MRVARVATASGPRPCVADGADWAVVEDAFASPPVKTGERIPAEGATLLAPVEPTVVLGMLHNSGPDDRCLPPQAFQKSARTVVGPGAPIVVDPTKGAVKGEAELALVVGRPARNISVADAPAYVLGWTVGNDVTASDQAALDETRTQAKNGDGFTPLGPWIETDLDALAQALTASVDGRVVAESSTDGLAWNPFEVFAYLTTHLTLGPGDVVLTGAPGTAFDIAPGAVASCTVAGVGELTNPVHALELSDHHEGA